MHFMTPSQPPQLEFQPSEADWLEYGAWADETHWPEDDRDAPAPAPGTDGWETWLTELRDRAFAEGLAAQRGRIFEQLQAAAYMRGLVAGYDAAARGESARFSMEGGAW